MCSEVDRIIATKFPAGTAAEELRDDRDRRQAKRTPPICRESIFNADAYCTSDLSNRFKWQWGASGGDA